MRPKQTLEEILARNCIDDMDSSMHSTLCKCSENKAAILALVKAQVPEKILSSEKTDLRYHEVWNDCRQKMLENLEKL